MSTCCCCASYLRDSKLPRSPTSEKPLAFDRHLDCCGRIICAACQYQNRRFETYCPFCQISSKPSALPQNGLRLPPAYTKTDGKPVKSPHGQQSAEDNNASAVPPPPYSSLSSDIQPSAATSGGGGGVSEPPIDTPDTIHHLSLTDTLTSLSLAYNVTPQVLRVHNALYDDHLLSGRKYILIPASHYQGPSLSQPPDPAEEERKVRVRRWMVATKCADYAVAELYLKGADGDLERAVEGWRADEEWERRNPLGGKGKGKGRGNGLGMGMRMGSGAIERRRSSGVGGGSLARQLS